MLENNQDDFPEFIAREQRMRLENVIYPFLSEQLKPLKAIELFQAGKFLTLLDSSAGIVKHADSPDFIISYNGEIIGLEHQRIFNKDNVQKVKSFSKLFNDAAEFFKAEHPELKLVANCYLKTNNFSFSKFDTDKLKKEISDYIFALASNNLLVKKPSYIDTIRYYKATIVSFTYEPGPRDVIYIDTESLKKAIAKKELLVDRYKTNSKIEKQWLLIVIDSLSADSFDLSDKDFLINSQSNFNRIYLMEEFMETIRRLK